MLGRVGGGPETPRGADSSAAGACRVFITAYLLLSRTAPATPAERLDEPELAACKALACRFQFLACN